jgi:hypothetical protein
MENYGHIAYPGWLSACYVAYAGDGLGVVC